MPDTMSKAMPETILDTMPRMAAPRGRSLMSVKARAGFSGFPSPAENYTERPLDLNEHLIKHPAATFFMRVEGHSMRAFSIHDNDLLVVDRSLKADFGRIIVALVDGEIVVKRLEKRANRAWLCSGHPDHPPLEVSASSLQVWGVVRTVIHELPT